MQEAFEATTYYKAQSYVATLPLFVGYRILQTLLLVMLLICYDNYRNQSDHDYPPNSYNLVYIYTILLAYLTPIVGILMFLIMKHGWILDLCIVYCTDYLSYLNTIQRNPDTGQETKQSIRAALSLKRSCKNPR